MEKSKSSPKKQAVKKEPEVEFLRSTSMLVTAPTTQISTEARTEETETSRDEE